MDITLVPQLIDEFFKLKQVIQGVRHSEYIKMMNKRYYQKTAEARKQKYREAHPNPKPRGRPRKQDIES